MVFLTPIKIGYFLLDFPIKKTKNPTSKTQGDNVVVKGSINQQKLEGTQVLPIQDQVGQVQIQSKQLKKKACSLILQPNQYFIVFIDFEDIIQNMGGVMLRV